MRILDQTRPHAEVHGLPGAVYEQDGVHYKNDFTEAFAADEAPIVEELSLVEDNAPHPIIAIIEQQTELEDTSSGETLDTMNVKALKLLLGSYGEEWPGSRQEAIAKVRGLTNGLE